MASGTEDEDLLWSDDLLQSFRRSAFRLETRSTYALTYERADFERFLAGSPVPPPQLDWWHPWLDEIARLTAEGKTVARVRVLDEPPTDYQRWEMWAARWHSQAGERIGYMPRSRAQRIGLPLLHDWWLLDDERVIAMWFTSAGEISDRELITEPGAVARFCEWRDLAVRNATTAEAIAAA
jgi:hypothetical protein